MVLAAEALIGTVFSYTVRLEDLYIYNSTVLHVLGSRYFVGNL